MCLSDSAVDRAFPGRIAPGIRACNFIEVHCQLRKLPRGVFAGDRLPVSRCPHHWAQHRELPNRMACRVPIACVVGRRPVRFRLLMCYGKDRLLLGRAECVPYDENTVRLAEERHMSLGMPGVGMHRQPARCGTEPSSGSGCARVPMFEGPREYRGDITDITDIRPPPTRGQEEDTWPCP